jgi:putative peptide zinc metalloprotease protein
VGIAMLVYTFFIKAIGILLFLVEIGWFILLPVQREMAFWYAHWPTIRQGGRARIAIVLVLAGIALLLSPWPSRISASALLRPADQLVLYAPPRAYVVAMPVAEGQRVEAGTVLLRLTSPDLAGRRASTQAKAESLHWQATAGAFDNEQRAHWQVLQEQLATAEAERVSVEADAALYEPVAPFAGILADIDPELRPGIWLARGEPLARLIADGRPNVVAYLDEEDIARVGAGDRAMFYADTPSGPTIQLRVSGIDADASRNLPEVELANQYGGNIAVREKNGQLHPERPIFRVSLKAEGNDEHGHTRTWRGKVVIAGAWSAPGWRYLRAALATVRREAGF